MELGEYTVPDLGIDSAKDIVQTIRDRLGGVVTSDNEEELAIALGHETADSGAFRSKVADLKKYGLLEGWGEKSLTPLAHELIEDEQTAVLDTMDNVDLFKKAHRAFGDSTPELDEWKVFLDKIGVEGPDINKGKKAWKRYNELARKLPTEEGVEEEKGEGFDEVRFNKYLDIYKEHESKREYAIDALKNVVKQPLPSVDPFDKIRKIVEKNRYPDDFNDFLYILHRMGRESTDMIRSKREEQVVGLIFDILETRSSDGTSWDRSLDFLKTLYSSDLDQELAERLWELAKDKLSEGIEQEDATTRHMANEIVDRLTRGPEWADKKLRNQMEEEIWEAIGEEDDELYDDLYKRWLKKLGVL